MNALASRLWEKSRPAVPLRSPQWSVPHGKGTPRPDPAFEWTPPAVPFKVKSDADLETLKKLAAMSPVYNTITNPTPVEIVIEKK